MIRRLLLGNLNTSCVTDINHWMSAHRLKQNTEKTELLWSGSKYSLSKLDGRGPAVKLGSDTIEPNGHVHCTRPRRCRLI